MTIDIRGNRTVSERSKYENLVRSHSAWLYRYAYWLCGEKSIAEDLVQDTFLRAWRFRGSLKDERAGKSWLTTILRRENARRFERRQLEYVDTETEDLPVASPEAGTHADILALRKAVQELPVKYREPLVLQSIVGHTLEEIAAILQIPKETIGTRLFRGRRKLSKMLQDEGGDSRQAAGFPGVQKTNVRYRGRGA